MINELSVGRAEKGEKKTERRGKQKKEKRN